MHVANETTEHTPKRVLLFSWVKEDGNFFRSPSNSPMGGRQPSEWMEYFYYVPNGFPMMFLKGVPNSTSF